MGLQDRDYVRGKQGSSGRRGSFRGGGAGPSATWYGRLFDRLGWSVTVWLVVINVTVFVGEMLIRNTPWGTMAIPSMIAWTEGATPDMKARAVRPTNVPLEQRLANGVPIVDPQTNQLIGRERWVVTNLLQGWGHFSTAKAFLALEVWRFISFQFLHVSLIHLVLNMLALWVFGPDVEEYLGRKRYMALYLVCGVFGAVSYLLLNLLGQIIPGGSMIPGLLVDDVRTPLVGASAGIFGIMLAAAFVAPNRVIQVLFVFSVRQRPAIYAFLAIAILSLLLGSNNAGGEAAHIGGAAAGYYFIRRMYLLRDFFDVLGEDGASAKGAPRGGKPAPKPGPSSQVDAILDKIRQQGQESLSDAERKILAEATAARQQGDQR
jgi:membrane associated rhomboid family serine protease